MKEENKETLESQQANEEQKNNIETEAKDDKKEAKRSEIKKLKAELEELQGKYSDAQKKNEELLDMCRRLAAEFDNYKKRTAKEMDSRYQDSKCDTVKKIIPVVDNFERALKTEVPEECKQYILGVEMIFNQLNDILKELGVKEIDALGKEFDPQYHNAVLHTEDDSVGENTVVEVFEKGYTLGDKVIRYSTVRVAN